MSREATKLAADLPNYSATLSEKIKRCATPRAIERAEKGGRRAYRLAAAARKPEARRPTPSVGTPPCSPTTSRSRSRSREPDPSGWGLYQTIVGTLLPPLATAGIVLLFVIFILLQREDLRDRLIRLFGGSDLQRATSTMTDAASRLSRYFLSQVLINFSFGALIAVALWLIGMPSPIAWGILAGLMRFVPFIGAYIAAAFPLLHRSGDRSRLVDLRSDVLALFVVSELTMGQVVEPLVFGRGTGITPIAVIVSTVFWTWLWGPLGLLLAMPMTVVPRRARPPCRRSGILRRSARRRARAHAGSRASISAR